jgi:hypothetical protein
MLASGAKISQAKASVAWWITAPGRDRNIERRVDPTGFS